MEIAKEDREEEEECIIPSTPMSCVATSRTKMKNSAVSVYTEPSLKRLSIRSLRRQQREAESKRDREREGERERTGHVQYREK